MARFVRLVAASVALTLACRDASDPVVAHVVEISAVSPSPLIPGVSTTIAGSGFSFSPAANTVTIDGIQVTVTAATTTSLTFIVPALPCTPTHDVIVAVTAFETTAQTTVQVQPATVHTLPPGGSVILSETAAARCNELHNAAGPAMYYLTVYNTNTAAPFGIGADFELRGSTSAAPFVAAPSEQIISRAAPSARLLSQEEAEQQAHLEFFQRELELLRKHAPGWRRGTTAQLLLPPVAYAVGDDFGFKFMNRGTQNQCADYVQATGRVAYVGAKLMIVEDNSNVIRGTFDSLYQSIGAEYDSLMAPLVEANFGNPLLLDASLDNNGRVVMIVTNRVRGIANGVFQAFVNYTDLLPTSQCAASNVGEYFYNVAPLVEGGPDDFYSPVNWRWRVRSIMVHETKHVAALASRITQNGGTSYETFWLEEATATIAEELYERKRYGFPQRGNIGYGNASNPVGPYCGFRRACGPRGIFIIWTQLESMFYRKPHEHSPLASLNATDFSYYQTAWSLIRWALDANAGNEATLLKALVQEPTKSGIANFESVFGMPFTAAQPKWAMSMVLDDYPGFTPADPLLKQPSWNFRDIYAGLNSDRAEVTVDWPFNPNPLPFGGFTTTANVRPGASAIIELSGTQSQKQLLELTGLGTAAAPADLRLAIVRVK